MALTEQQIAEEANRQWLADLPVATIGTAFGKRMPVRVVERDGAEASIVLPSGRRACVQWKSLDFTAQPEPEQASDPVTEPGLYEQDGTIFKVQQSKTSGNLYAKRLIIIGGKRLMGSGEKANLEYEYAPGALRGLRAADKMDLETAVRFGIEYGFCVRCGAFLKDADSVEAGIGPVCRKAFGA